MNINIDALTRYWTQFLVNNCSGEPFKFHVREALEVFEEVRRLRASQFRWIPVSEELPNAQNSGSWVFAFRKDKTEPVVTWWSEIHKPFFTHWAPIPPLPEKSEEQKDLDLAYEYVKEILPTSDLYNASRHAFLAGLKAARESK